MRTLYEKGGKVITGQNTSTVRREQGPDGATREFVWFDAQGNEGAPFDAPDGDWARTGAVKVYGNWNEYAAGQNEDGSMYLPDEQFPIMQNEDGSFSLNESAYESAMGGQGATRSEDMMEMMMDAQRNREVGLEALGGVPSGPRVMRQVDPRDVATEMVGGAGKVAMGGNPVSPEFGKVLRGGRGVVNPAQVMAAQATGGQGALPIEDLLERLNDYRR